MKLYDFIVSFFIKIQGFCELLRRVKVCILM